MSTDDDVMTEGEKKSKLTTGNRISRFDYKVYYTQSLVERRVVGYERCVGSR